jgi:hypothetical protein
MDSDLFELIKTYIDEGHIDKIKYVLETIGDDIEAMTRIYKYACKFGGVEVLGLINEHVQMYGMDLKCDNYHYSIFKQLTYFRNRFSDIACIYETIDYSCIDDEHTIGNFFEFTENCDKTIVMALLIVISDDINHACCISIVDDVCFFFNPWGFDVEEDVDYVCYKSISSIIRNYANVYEYSYGSSENKLPLQMMEISARKRYKPLIQPKYTIDTKGLCAAWVCLYMETQLENPELSSDEIFDVITDGNLCSKIDGCITRMIDTGIVSRMRHTVINKIDGYNTSD